MIICKIKSKANQVIKKLSKSTCRMKILLRFSHVWVCFIIFAITLIVLFLSIYMNDIGQGYWSSIFANLFAGFITGLVICLISSIKQVSIIKLKEKKFWLEHLKEMIMQYLSKYNDLLHMHFERFDGDEEKFNLIYDVGSHANWVNAEILQSSFNKTLSFNPFKYCKKRLGYDALAMCSKYQQLHDNLCMIDIYCPSDKTIREYFENTDKALRKLNSELNAAINNLDIQLSGIQRTIV